MKALLSCTILLLLGASLSSAGILVSSETSASAEKQDVYGPVFSSGGSFGYGTFVNPVYRWPSVSTGILWPGNIPVQTIPLYPYSPSVPGGPPILEDDENSNREPLMPDNGDYVDPETGLSRDKREVPFVEDAAWWNGKDKDLSELYT